MYVRRAAASVDSPKHFRKGGRTIHSLQPREQDSFCNTEEKVGGKASGRDGCIR